MPKQSASVLLAVLIASVCLHAAETPKERELAVQLAAMRAQLALAVRDRAALTAALAGVSRSAASGRVKASDKATEIADNATEVADTHATEGAEVVQAVGEKVVARVDQSQESSDKGYRTLLVAQIVLFLGFLGTEYRARRDRKWRKDDADELERKAEKHRNDVLQKLDFAGEKADQAYKEANTVNLKLETIGVKMADNKPLETPKPAAGKRKRRHDAEIPKTAGAPAA